MHYLKMLTLACCHMTDLHFEMCNFMIVLSILHGKMHLICISSCTDCLQNIKYISKILICDSTYRKVPVVGRLDFELWGCKVKISQNIVPMPILRFHIHWNLQYLILNIPEGFVAKTVFSCKK